MIIYSIEHFNNINHVQIFIPIKSHLYTIFLRMLTPGMLGRVALARIDVLEGRITSIIRVERISELGTFAVTSNRSTLQKSVLQLLVTANVALAHRCFPP
jgi:hypothetical protein